MISKANEHRDRDIDRYGDRVRNMYKDIFILIRIWIRNTDRDRKKRTCG